MKYPYSQHEIHIVNTALNKKKQTKKQAKQTYSFGILHLFDKQLLKHNLSCLY